MRNKGKEVVYCDRQFLNKPGYNGMANIVAEISHDWWREKEFADIDITLGIADCNRQITFTFDMDSDEDWENNIYKIDKMAEMMTNLKVALEAEYGVWRRFEELKKAAKEAEKKAAEENKDTESES